MTKNESLKLLEKCIEILKNSTDDDKRKMRQLYFSELYRIETCETEYFNFNKTVLFNKSTNLPDNYNLGLQSGNSDIDLLIAS